MREIEDRAREDERQREDRMYSTILNILQGNHSDLEAEVQTDFALPIEIIPFPPPRNEEDFNIPDDWKPEVVLDYKQFKLISQNSYRGIAAKPGDLCIDENPLCSCSKEDGCNHLCQNRQLFM
jgi:hypothetical protein